MTINESLDHLDPSNDEHWTGQGLPSVLAISKLTGLKVLTRKQITEARPGFSRVVEATVVEGAGLAERRERLTHELDEAQGQRFALEVRVQSLMRDIDTLTEQIERENPLPTLADNVRVYQEKQHELRESGGRSPIDKALARSHNRAKQRPSFGI